MATLSRLGENRNPAGRTPPAARLSGEIIYRFLNHAEIISIQAKSYRIHNRRARRPGKHGDYAAAMPPPTGRPAQTARTEPKPLARRSEEDDSSTQYPPPGGGFSGADAWPVLKRRMTERWHLVFSKSYVSFSSRHMHCIRNDSSAASRALKDRGRGLAQPAKKIGDPMRDPATKRH